MKIGIWRRIKCIYMEKDSSENKKRKEEWQIERGTNRVKERKTERKEDNYEEGNTNGQTDRQTNKQINSGRQQIRGNK